MVESGSRHTFKKKEFEALILTIEQKLRTYQAQRHALPCDADGIYIIVEGEARIVNKFEPDSHLKVLQRFEYFGESKFLAQQGYSYFGDIVAHEPQSKIPAANTALKSDTKDRKRSIKRGPASVSAVESAEKVVTTCLFLPQSKLYLIPFYDLQLLRENSKAKKRLQSLRKECQKNYAPKIRNMKNKQRGEQ